MGIEACFVVDELLEVYEKFIDENIKALYVEVIGNLSFNVLDFEGIVVVVKKYDILFVVDNIFGVCGYVFWLFDYGVNIVV